MSKNISKSKLSIEPNNIISKNNNGELVSYEVNLKTYYKDKISKIKQDFNKAKNKIKELERNKLNQLKQRLNQLKEKNNNQVIDITPINQNITSTIKPVDCEDEKIQELNNRLNIILNKKGNK